MTAKAATQSREMFNKMFVVKMRRYKYPKTTTQLQDQRDACSAPKQNNIPESSIQKRKSTRLKNQKQHKTTMETDEPNKEATNVEQNKNNYDVPQEVCPNTKVVVTTKQLTRKTRGTKMATKLNRSNSPVLRMNTRANKQTLKTTSEQPPKEKNVATSGKIANQKKSSVLEAIAIDEVHHRPQREKSTYRKSKNLAHKTNLIEDLIADSENEQENHNPSDVQCEIAVGAANMKPHKFFHREGIDTKNDQQNNVPTPHKIGRRKKMSKKSIGKLYDFPSQSLGSSDSNTKKKIDPAEDIIKKLISEGKVAVATNYKGRPKIKRINNVKKKVVKRKQNQQKCPSQLIENQDVVQEVEDDNFGDSYNNFANNDEHFEELQNQRVIDNSLIYSTNNNQHRSGMPEGIFSPLAQKVLINQTTSCNAHNVKTYGNSKIRLLEMAKKFVSTPIREGVPDVTTRASPTLQSNMIAKSPWRVDESAHLPGVFNFSRDSSNLPSFSSDWIPASQNNIEVLPEKSSCTSIDSNEENRQPEGVKCPMSDDAGANIFNYRQMPNPQRNLPNREPLKEIFILENITLPSWKQAAVKGYEKEKDANDSPSKSEPLFGFENYLDEDEEERDLNSSKQSPVVKQQKNNTLREKLHKLRHWRPDDKDFLQSNSKSITSLAFDDDRPNKQRNIKEMLCSTMINDGKNVEKKNESDKVRNNPEKTETIDPVLFKDDADTAFDTKNLRRTYTRPPKRKRRSRHNFVMLIESEDSADDNDDNNDNNNNDNDTSNEKVNNKRKKRQKVNKDNKPNAALDSFVNEFNEMCKEVEKYELVVEKSNVED